jgi:hypothetical protein
MAVGRRGSLSPIQAGVAGGDGARLGGKHRSAGADRGLLERSASQIVAIHAEEELCVGSESTNYRIMRQEAS